MLTIFVEHFVFVIALSHSFIVVVNKLKLPIGSHCRQQRPRRTIDPATHCLGVAIAGCSDWVIEFVLWWFEPLVTIFFFMFFFFRPWGLSKQFMRLYNCGGGMVSSGGMVLRCCLSVAFGDPLKPLRWWITFDFRALRTR